MIKTPMKRPPKFNAPEAPVVVVPPPFVQKVLIDRGWYTKEELQAIVNDKGWDNNGNPQGPQTEVVGGANPPHPANVPAGVVPGNGSGKPV